MSKFSSALTAYMQRNKMTQRELAEKLMSHESQVSRWLSGDREPTVATLKAISKRIGVPVADLV